MGVAPCAWFLPQCRLLPRHPVDVAAEGGRGDDSGPASASSGTGERDPAAASDKCATGEALKLVDFVPSSLCVEEEVTRGWGDPKT